MPSDELETDGDQMISSISDSSDDVGTLNPNDPEVILDIMAFTGCTEAEAKKLLKRFMTTIERLKQSKGGEH